MEEKESKKGRRGRETLFRSAYQNQSNLIRVADNKANMIISINAMIISSIIAITGYGAVANKLESANSLMLAPMLMIILASLISVVLAIQAARPKLLKAKRLPSGEEKSSLLFYGVISTYTQEEYIREIRSLLASGEDLYEHMTIDLHNQGRILNRKYKLLAYAYQVFMYGIILGVSLFIFFLLWGNQA
ncbi:MAG: metal-dependent phosphohydrolase [Bacteroidetes bacterium]|nr:metal-dependent phosphohydrolase [Bacteroidota bacterium]